MAPSRAYVPSIALLRALSSPGPLRCPLGRRLPTQCLRGKRTKATPTNPNDPKYLKGVHNAFGVKPTSIAEELGKKVTSISWYERDLDRPGPDRLIEKIETPEQLAKHQRRWQMHQENERDPDYDDTELKRDILDDMMRNPTFADLRDALEAMKKRVVSKQEVAKMVAEGDRPDADTDTDAAIMKDVPELAELDASAVMAFHEQLQQMIEDPDYATVRDDIVSCQSRLSEWQLGGPEIEEAFERLDSKLMQIPAHQQRMAALEAHEKEEKTKKAKMKNKSQDPFETMLESDLSAESEGKDLDLDDLESNEAYLDSLLKQMRDVMAAMGGDKELEGKIQEVLDSDPLTDGTGEAERGIDFKDLAQQITELKNESSLQVEEAEKPVDADIELLVDKIMEDPDLIQKLTMIKSLIAARQGDMTTRSQPSAPDPDTLDRADLATYRERLQIAENDPEHIAALRRLRVNLLPPFHVSPALKALNQALKLAYLGASDDVRRVLWRSYNKARTVPTLLQNITDDAWDMLWYSQAVTWGSNQNRQTHLKILLQDLNSVGKDGPPTHPDTIAAQ